MKRESVINAGSSLAPYLRELKAAAAPPIFLYGIESVYPTAVRFATYAVLQNSSVLVVDGANAFYPYEAARVARRHQRHPESVLKAIRVARAFTCHQLRELVFRLDRHLDAARPVVIIMGLCTTFFDDDVPHSEAASLFYRTLWKVSDLSQQGMPLLIAQSSSPVNNRRKYFLQDVYDLSDFVLRMEPARDQSEESWLSRLNNSCLRVGA